MVQLREGLYLHCSRLSLETSIGQRTEQLYHIMYPHASLLTHEQVALVHKRPTFAWPLFYLPFSILPLGNFFK